MRSFQDLKGREVALGRFLGSGGEGAVYSVQMRPELVAKIYVRTPEEHMGRKLDAMVQLGTEALATLAAWPVDLLFDESTGSAVGFLMPRVEDHRGIHTLYGPTNRKTVFPDATWALLVRAARNLAATFDTVHRHGHVIGDVNEGNIVVSRKATVRIIDCDSFQITHLGHTYPCRVGVPLYTPPELQGQCFEGVVRTPDHDRFGLAVLVFQLLFMGRHPFAGLHPERAIPVGMAIREGLFAFGSEAARQGWEPPPHSLRLTDVALSIAHLFEEAFGRDAAAGAPRPTAAEWITALDALEGSIVICGKNQRHAHISANGSCPWCRIENEGGPSFFLLLRAAALREVSGKEWEDRVGLMQYAARNPRDLDTFKKLGDMYARTNHNKEAAQEYAKVAEFYAKEGFLLKAIAVWKQIQKLDPAALEAYVHLAELYAKQGLMVEAKGQYQIVVDEYKKRGNIRNAGEALRQMAEIDPDDLKIQSMLADLYVRDGNAGKAIEVHITIAERLNNKGHPAEALLVLERGLKIDPKSGKLRAELARVHLLQKNWDKAVQVLEEATRQSPNDTQVQLKLGEAYLGAKKIEQAEGIFRQLLQQDPQDQDARILMARVQRLRGHFDEPAPPAAPSGRPSIELSSSLTGDDREFIDEHLAEGRVFRKYGLQDKAVDQFLAVVARFPDNLEARQELRDVFKDKGEKEKAAEQSLALAEICRLKGDATAAKRHESDASDA